MILDSRRVVCNGSEEQGGVLGGACVVFQTCGAWPPLFVFVFGPVQTAVCSAILSVVPVLGTTKMISLAGILLMLHCPVGQDERGHYFRCRRWR